MAKKKSAATEKNALQMIHFRPGPELGALIDQFALQASISRGESAKRMASLAFRGFDIEVYGEIEELSTYLYGNSTFDEASQMAYVHLATTVGEPTTLSRESRQIALNELIAHYRSTRQLEEKVSEKRVRIKILRTRD